MDCGSDVKLYAAVMTGAMAFTTRARPTAWAAALTALPATRKALQADLTRFIREMGPKLGDIYYDKNVDWKEIQAASRRSSLSPETKKYS